MENTTTITTMVGMVRFTQWPASIPNALALLASKSLSLRWREEPVEVEGQGVELLIPAVASERPEPRPPWHPPVPRRIPHLQGVVEDHRDDQTDGRGRGEDGVDVVIEPSCPGVCRAVQSAHGVAEEVLRDGNAEEQRDADDEEAAHRVHVGELHEGEPHCT
jgi:hypothetical protein